MNQGNPSGVTKVKRYRHEPDAMHEDVRGTWCPAKERDLLLQRNAMLVEALTRLAKRPSGHHDCDDYTRGYGQCQADMASIAEAALKDAKP